MPLLFHHDLACPFVQGAAASIDPGGAPGPAQAVSLPDKPGPAQAVSPPDQPGPAQTASPPDKPGPAQAANPPDQPGPAQAVGPPDKPAPAQAVSPPDNQRYPLAQPGAAPNIPDLPAFAQQLWNKYQGRLQGPNATGSTIVHKCVARVGCGGWGDRLRGMTTLFYFALLTDSQASAGTVPSQCAHQEGGQAGSAQQHGQESMSRTGAMQEAMSCMGAMEWSFL